MKYCVLQSDFNRLHWRIFTKRTWTKYIYQQIYKQSLFMCSLFWNTNFGEQLFNRIKHIKSEKITNEHLQNYLGVATISVEIDLLHIVLPKNGVSLIIFFLPFSVCCFDPKLELANISKNVCFFLPIIVALVVIIDQWNTDSLGAFCQSTVYTHHACCGTEK